MLTAAIFLVAMATLTSAIPVPDKSECGKDTPNDPEIAMEVCMASVVFLAAPNNPARTEVVNGVRYDTFKVTQMIKKNGDNYPEEIEVAYNPMHGGCADPYSDKYEMLITGFIFDDEVTILSCENVRKFSCLDTDTILGYTTNDPCDGEGHDPWALKK